MFSERPPGTFPILVSSRSMYPSLQPIAISSSGRRPGMMVPCPRSSGSFVSLRTFLRFAKPIQVHSGSDSSSQNASHVVSKMSGSKVGSDRSPRNL